MKIAKLFTIDIEIAEKLKDETNASELVNKLLKDYFGNLIGYEKDDLLEKKKILETEVKRQEKILKGIDEKVKNIAEKEKNIKKMFDKIPEEIIEDIKRFEKMTMPTLALRFKTIYSKKYPSLKLDDVLNCFEASRN